MINRCATNPILKQLLNGCFLVEAKTKYSKLCGEIIIFQRIKSIEKQQQRLDKINIHLIIVVNCGIRGINHYNMVALYWIKYCTWESASADGLLLTCCTRLVRVSLQLVVKQFEYSTYHARGFPCASYRRIEVFRGMIYLSSVL